MQRLGIPADHYLAPSEEGNSEVGVDVIAAVGGRRIGVQVTDIDTGDRPGLSRAHKGGSAMGLPAHHCIAIAIPLALVLSGCASPQDSYESRMRATAQEFVDKLKAQSQAQIADYDRRLETLREYSACNRNASRIVAVQPGDPISLAVAARNLCRSDEVKLRNAIYAAYSDNPSFGMEAMEKIRKSILENNTGEIVAYRAKANSTPAPSRPTESPPTERRI
jgi:hypothetical protein